MSCIWSPLRDESIDRDLYPAQQTQRKVVPNNQKQQVLANTSKAQPSSKPNSLKAPLQQKKEANKATRKAEKTNPKKQVSSNTTALKVKANAGIKTATMRSGPGIPHSPVSGPLKFPKQKGRSSGDIIEKRLQKKSPWYQSILDPLTGADVKIPDAVGVETGTLQLVHREPLTTNGNGVGGFRTVCLHPNLSGGTPAPFNYQTMDSSALENSIVWQGSSSPTFSAFETSSVLQAYADGVRIVSAALYVQSEVSLATNTGLMIGYVNPYPDALIANGNTSSVYADHFKSAIVPINNNEPIVTRFFPIKQNGGEYDMFYAPTEGAGDGVNTGTGAVLNPFWEMGVIIVGQDSGARFLATMVVNYEFVPVSNAINILDAKPSPHDAQETDLVENWVQDMPPVTVTRQNVVSTAASSSSVPEPGGDSGFGMFFEVITELLPLVLSVL